MHALLIYHELHSLYHKITNLNYIGFPIYNDPLYTGDSTTEFGQFLHSTSIEFDHPITGKHLHFEVGVPEEFQKFLNTLEEK